MIWQEMDTKNGYVAFLGGKEVAYILRCNSDVSKYNCYRINDLLPFDFGLTEFQAQRLVEAKLS